MCIRDRIGTLSAQAEQAGLDTIILTGDTDTLQLVSPQTRVLLSYSAQQQKVFDEDAVRERYKGLGPEHIPDIKGLEGDSSDNIPGVPGVGRGTAIKLLTQFETLDNIYERIDEVASPRIRQLLIDHKDAAFEGRHLTTIVRNMPIKLDVEGVRFGAFSREKVTGALRDLEFVSMIRRIPGGSNAAPQQPVQGTLMDMSATDEVDEEAPREKIETVYQCIDTVQGLGALIEELYLAKRFAFDTETSGLDPTRADLVGLSFSTKAGNGFYLPLGHTKGSVSYTHLTLPTSDLV